MVSEEVKFKGQVGVATQFFSTIISAEQRRLLQASLPLIFGFVLTIIDSSGEIGAPERLPSQYRFSLYRGW